MINDHLCANLIKVTVRTHSDKIAIACIRTNNKHTNQINLLDILFVEVPPTLKVFDKNRGYLIKLVCVDECGFLCAKITMNVTDIP